MNRIRKEKCVITTTGPGPGPTEHVRVHGACVWERRACDNNQFYVSAFLPKCTERDEISDRDTHTLNRISRETIDRRIRLCHSDGVDGITPPLLLLPLLPALLLLLARNSMLFRRARASNCARVTSATQRSKSCWGNCHSPNTTGCKSCVTWTVM